MSVEKLDNTLGDLWRFLEELKEKEQYAERDQLAEQVYGVVDLILRAAKGQQGPMTFPQQNQPISQQQPGPSGGSSQHTLTPQPAVTQSTGTIECPRCNQILNIDVTLS